MQSSSRLDIPGHFDATGSGMVKCPSHPDDTASLSIARGKADDRWVVHCHAGCRPDAVLAAVGLTMSDLFDTANGTGKRTRVADIIYQYEDAAEVARYEAVRSHPKKFWQRRIAADGSRVWDMDGVDRVPYHLPEMLAGIAAGEVVLLVEGEKDVLRLEAEGFVATTTIGGAKGWMDDYAKWFTRAGVAILPDNDGPGRNYAEAAARSLVDEAAEVRVVSLPGLDPGGDVSNYLDKHTAKDLKDLIIGAPEWSPTESETVEPEALVVPPPSSPLPVARKWMEANYASADGYLLRCHQSDFFAYSGTHWPEVAATNVRAQLYSWLEHAVWEVVNKDGFVDTVPWDPSRFKISNVVDALRSGIHLDEAVVAPAWLGGDTAIPAADLTAVRNGLLHLRTRQLLPHTPAYWSHNSLPFDYEPDAPEPVRWLSFLGDLWEDDKDTIDTLQEIFGYLLTADTSQQKIFLLVGPKRSGKGTVARVLTGLLGTNNVTAPTLAGLSTNFGLAPLIGRMVAIVSDARLGTRADSAIVTERLLSISGEDSLTIDRKYREAWTGRMQTRFLIMSNELPRLSDSSGALASRFIVLPLTQSFYGKEDPTLTDKLLTEATGILRWSLDGLDRLRSRGHFTQPKAGAAAVRQLEDLGAPISSFIRELCEVGPTLSVRKERMYHAWRSWCEDRGLPVSSDPTFARDLLSAQPEIQVSRPREDGSRVHDFLGIDLRPEVTHD